MCPLHFFFKKTYLSAPLFCDVCVRILSQRYIPVSLFCYTTSLFFLQKSTYLYHFFVHALDIRDLSPPPRPPRPTHSVTTPPLARLLRLQKMAGDYVGVDMLLVRVHAQVQHLKKRNAEGLCRRVAAVGMENTYGA